jgi:hypothetical protein
LHFLQHVSNASIKQPNPGAIPDWLRAAPFPSTTAGTLTALLSLGSNPNLTMQTSFHDFCELFAQLGLPSDERDIGAFIATNAPLPSDMELWEAPFWTPAQAELLRMELADDGDWSMAIDQLNLALRAQ